MVKILLGYFVIQLNGLLLNHYLQGNIELPLLTMSQISLLVISGYYITKSHQTTSWKERVYWGILLFSGMVICSLVLSLFIEEASSNQETLRVIQENLPKLSFYLFLIIASLLEEGYYREILWKNCRMSSTKIVITSLFFTLSHNPISFSYVMMYGCLGIFLALMRVKTDLRGSCFLHLIWNSLVFLITGGFLG